MLIDVLDLTGCFTGDQPGNLWSDDQNLCTFSIGSSPNFKTGTISSDILDPKKIKVIDIALLQSSSSHGIDSTTTGIPSPSVKKINDDLTLETNHLNLNEIHKEEVRKLGGADRTSPHAGMLIDGRYRLERCLGTGGFASVWRASHLILHQAVALKLLTPEGRATADNLCREAKHAASITHPHVVRILDAAVLADTAYVVMELVQGQPLSQVLIERKRIGWKETCQLMRGVFQGLEAARQAGIVHRDIKPANLLVDEGGLVKIADFGLASYTRRETNHGDEIGSVVGTPAYMAPEQAKDPDQCTWQSDLYAMGCVFFHCLTGQPPFQGSTSIETITMHCYQPIPHVQAHVDCPADLAQLIQQMLAKEPAARPSSFSQVIDRIDNLLVSPVRSSSFIRRLIGG